MTTYSSPVPVGSRPTSGFRTKARPDQIRDLTAKYVGGGGDIEDLH